MAEAPPAASPLTTDPLIDTADQEALLDEGLKGIRTRLEHALDADEKRMEQRLRDVHPSYSRVNRRTRHQCQGLAAYALSFQIWSCTTGRCSRLLLRPHMMGPFTFHFLCPPELTTMTIAADATASALMPSIAPQRRRRGRIRMRISNCYSNQPVQPSNQPMRRWLTGMRTRLATGAWLLPDQCMQLALHWLHKLHCCQWLASTAAFL